MVEFMATCPDKLYRGNSITFNCHLNLNLTNYKIRAELFDRFYSSLTYATANVTGGADTQINIVSEANGTFDIFVLKDTTDLFHLISYLEVEIEDDAGLTQTVYFAPIKFQDDIYLRG